MITRLLRWAGVQRTPLGVWLFHYNALLTHTVIVWGPLFGIHLINARVGTDCTTWLKVWRKS